MSIWQTAALALDAAQLAAFGAPIIYAKPGAPALSIIGERRARDPLEAETMANFERIWTTRAQLPFEPAQGDQVTIGATNYVVHAWKPDADPDSDGLNIYLSRRKSNA